MKVNQDALGKPCDKCRRPITQEVIDLIVGIKIANARKSAAKTKANGNKPGPKGSIYDWDRARELRSKYWSFAKIAREFGISREYVSREFKKRGWK